MWMPPTGKIELQSHGIYWEHTGEAWSLDRDDPTTTSWSAIPTLDMGGPGPTVSQVEEVFRWGDAMIARTKIGDLWGITPGGTLWPAWTLFYS